MVDVAGLPELTVVAQGVEQLGQTLQLDKLVAGLGGAHAPQDVDTGPVHHGSCWIPGKTKVLDVITLHPQCLILTSRPRRGSHRG